MYFIILSLYDNKFETKWIFVNSFFSMSPTHPGMMPTGIPPMRGVSSTGPRATSGVRGGPMGRGDYGEYFNFSI